ncbi:hypothetical protein Syun_012326 [Stephania yunnanensis]|uniref:Uncharacterized protein n=1 Tax=Stephania yunnanensis TaxID=152371 RepID=A0AAP0JZ75_9MAGN
MRRMMLTRFLLADFEQLLYHQYQHYTQNDCSVGVYTEEFFRLNARNNLYELENHQFARYIWGLKLTIQDQLVLRLVWHLFEAVNLIYKIEAQLNQPPPKTHFFRRVPFDPNLPNTSNQTNAPPHISPNQSTSQTLNRPKAFT